MSSPPSTFENPAAPPPLVRSAVDSTNAPSLPYPLPHQQLQLQQQRQQQTQHHDDAGHADAAAVTTAAADTSPSAARRPTATTTPVKAQLPARARTLPTALTARPQFEEDSPQLSERDSIFATHYVPSNSATSSPNLVPVHDPGQHAADVDATKHHYPWSDLASSSSRLQQQQQKQQPQLPRHQQQQQQRSSSSLFHMARSSPSPLDSYRFGENFRNDRAPPSLSPTSTPLTPTRWPESSLASSPRKFLNSQPDPFGREGQPADRNVSDSFSTSRKSSSLLRLSDHVTHDGTINYKPSSRDPSLPLQHRLEPSADKVRAPPSTAGRSPSRSRGPGPVEKKIEATLANVEANVNSRSRKSSHYLGLFKENTASKEHKKREETAKDRKPKEAGVEMKGDVTSNLAGAAGSPKSTNAIAVALPAEAPLSSPQLEANQPVPQPSADAQRSHLDRLISQQHRTDAAPPLLKSPLSPTPPLDVKTVTPEEGVSPTATEDGDTVTVAADTMVRSFPLRLLEEIRNRHNLTPGAARGTSFSRSIPTTISERSAPSSTTSPTGTKTIEPHDEAAASAVPVRPVHPSPTGRDDKEHVAEDEEDEEEESDKEQISSALYIPHQAPALRDYHEATDEHGLDEAKDQFVKAEREEPERKQWVPEREAPPSNEIDIAFQSQDESRFFHGDLQMPRTPPAEVTAPKPVPTADFAPSSASETEYESWDDMQRSVTEDESSLTDHAETTPTATPTGRSSVTRSSPRKVLSAQPTPLSAVELKPYNHQVGGHTTVFRFSKKAVCKQLSNRENEFYETVERKHPELLQFLPRYVWYSSIYS
ncbi:hypothetical protein L228DRAFT_43607 [Xylona heveae TC161]|uniref:Kinase n=1 Tax=Xylona heveae (strain CBS 132557 / TC161) TaxID=1328760 RepID=A0A164ZS88_XYLHT|nr:hypothetical protein L228DRAFT_43607 [Xylona heveae TC161]KZF19448.1 hypothetical protein L228DRAFT_43607 [Xylona heveae TC161]